MIQTVSLNEGLVYLKYQKDERDILLDYLINNYNIELIEYKDYIDTPNACYYSEKKLKVIRKDIAKVVDCIREIEKYKEYKTIEVKKLFSTYNGYQGLTRDEKLNSMKDIINNICIIMCNEEKHIISDDEYLRNNLL